MGFWSKLGGYAMMVGGVAAAPYTGGASLALVGAGANVVGNDMKKEGTEKAADQLTAANKQAMATQEQGKRDALQAYSPYTQTGAAAMGTLGSLMGLPVGTTVPGGALPAGTQIAAGMRDAPESLIEDGPTGRAAVPRDAANSPQATAMIRSASGYGSSLGGVRRGGLVQMRAPRGGETQWVPPDQVEHFTRLGATEIA